MAPMASRKRARYCCGLCGLLKKGHVCRFAGGSSSARLVLGREEAAAPMDPPSAGAKKEEVTIITALPNDVLGTIISAIPIDEAARTNAISKGWKHLWRDYTPLNLDDRDLHKMAWTGDNLIDLISNILEAPCKASSRLHARYVPVVFLSARYAVTSVTKTAAPSSSDGSDPSFSIASKIFISATCGNYHFRRVHISSQTIVRFRMFVDPDSDVMEELLIVSTPSLEEVMLWDQGYCGPRIIHVLVAPKLHILGCLHIDIMSTVQLGKTMLQTLTSHVPNKQNDIPVATTVDYVDRHLKQVVVRNYSGKKPDYNFAKFFLLNAKALESMKLHVPFSRNNEWSSRQRMKMDVKNRASPNAWVCFEDAE
ncbi:hypothetical protein CFC21_015191 [Triticum aestivum]|uniref:FBD domain-containing protein n=2 Tax=Triticum aestivum TaxID=4565 RepID=A0A9R1J014_WHEAT|nr:hypothetical protein CFC21_015191 [Triticum aestivum]